MSQGVISDNWSLQNITELFIDGLDHGQSDEIIINNNIHSYSPLSSAGIQTEALFDFLTDLILRDEIIVEEQYTSAWDQHDSPIIQARDLGVIKNYPFTEDYKKLQEPKAAVIDKICVTDSLKIQHKENVEGWQRNQKTPHALLSATLWGGAGMLSRSYVYEKGYTPHPLRRKFFINSGFMLPGYDSLHKLNSLISEKRYSLSKKVLGNDALYSMFITIPPLPINIINECDHPSKFVKVALQMRDEFLELRNWLKMFQNAITSDDIAEIKKYSGVLDSVGAYIDNKFGVKSGDTLTMSAGVSVFKIDLKGDPMNLVKNQFGIRSTINKLILNEVGRKSLSKYTNMFGEKGTDIGYSLEQYFANKIT